MKYLRLIFYVLILLLSAFFIQQKKASVVAERALEVESVLSIMSEKGLPLKVYEIKPRSFNRFYTVNLRTCDNVKCFFISRDEREMFKPGQVIKKFDEETSLGVIQSISNNAVPSTGLYQVNLNLNNKTNGSELVRVQTTSLANKIVIPLEAVTQIRNEVYVYLYENEKPVRRDIKIEMLSTNEVLVASGLKASDVVIVEGLSLIDLFDKYQVTGKFEFSEGKDL